MKRNLREAITSTIADGDLRHNMLGSINDETGADRIGALGRSDYIGAAMFRAIVDHDRRERKRAAILMAGELQRGRESLSMLIKICTIVIDEWFADKCLTCQGRGYLVSEGTARQVCTVCDGHRLRRHSDTERCKAMKISQHAYTKWERRFTDAHSLLAASNTKVIKDTGRQLERWAA